MTQLEAPELPEGYRFKVTLDRGGDVAVTLQKKSFWRWKSLGCTWFSRLTVKPEDDLLSEMHKLAMENNLLVDVSNRLLNLTGIYPPRKIIGEVNEG